MMVTPQEAKPCLHSRHVGTCPVCQRAQLARCREQLREVAEEVGYTWVRSTVDRQRSTGTFRGDSTPTIASAGGVSPAGWLGRGVGVSRVGGNGGGLVGFLRHGVLSACRPSAGVSESSWPSS